MTEPADMKGNSSSLPLTKRNVIKVKVNGVEKRYKPSRHYVFILQVRWSDLSEYVIYRKYSDFYTLQCSLAEKFPIEAGAIRESDRTLPYLPGRLLFSRTEVSKVANQRRVDLAKYCTSLLEQTAKIAHCTEVLDFFEATFEDINPPKDATKKPDRSRLILALLPFLKKKNKDVQDDLDAEDMTISGPISLETYSAAADYEATEKSEVTLTEGDHVEVFEKNNNGWWFVQTESGDQGWAPASYLDPVSHPLEIDEPDPTYKGNLERFITTEAYKAQFSDEISFEKEVILEVMHKLLDGWWIVSYQGNAGYAPAAYLEPYNNPHFLRSSTVKRPTVKPIPRRCTVKSKRNAWKKRTQRDLTIYRKYSRKRLSDQAASSAKPQPPQKPLRVTEESEDTSLYENINFLRTVIPTSVEEVEEEEEEQEEIVLSDRPGINKTLLDVQRVAPELLRVSSYLSCDSNCHSIPDIDLTTENRPETQILSQLAALSVAQEQNLPKAPPPPPPFIPSPSSPTSTDGQRDRNASFDSDRSSTLSTTSSRSGSTSGYGSGMNDSQPENDKTEKIWKVTEEELESETFAVTRL